jgi:hypothetical protein
MISDSDIWYIMVTERVDLDENRERGCLRASRTFVSTEYQKHDDRFGGGVVALDRVTVVGAGVVVDRSIRARCVRCLLVLYTNTIGRRGRSRGSKSRRRRSAYHTTPPSPPPYHVRPGVTITVAGDLLPHGCCCCCCCCCPPIHRDPL